MWIELDPADEESPQVNCLEAIEPPSGSDEDYEAVTWYPCAVADKETIGGSLALSWTVFVLFAPLSSLTVKVIV